VATAARRIVATSNEGGRPCSQSHQYAMASSLQFHNSPLYSSVNVHAVLGGGWLRRQPLDIANATLYWRDGSRRVSWQAAKVTTAYSCDQTKAELVFWLGDGWQRWRRSNFGFQRQWILNYVISFLHIRI
jgi:hypothetical protein